MLLEFIITCNNKSEIKHMMHWCLRLIPKKKKIIGINPLCNVWLIMHFITCCVIILLRMCASKRIMIADCNTAWIRTNKIGYCTMWNLMRSIPMLVMLARTNASAVEDKSKIDTSAVKGKTMIPKAEHEVMDMSYLMETIEAIPYHDLFIRSYEELLPRGLGR